jgi:hypothetical protein
MVQVLSIIPKPYLAGPPVSGARFYGRARLLAEILDGPDHTIWLVGNRRIGKTSALLQLAEAAGERGWVTFNVAIDAAESLERLAELFLENLEDGDPRLQRLGLALADLSGKAPREIIRAFNRAARARGERILLLLDEVEALIQIARAEGDQILKDLQHVIEHSEAIRVVMAASKRLLELDEICKTWDTSRFLDPVVPKYMGSLDRAETLALLRQEQSPRPQPVDDAVAEAIYQATAGHPYLTQWLASQLWADGVVRMPAPEDLLPAADAQLARMFQQDYDTLSDNERRLLRALADADALSADEAGQQLGGGATPELARSLLTGLAQLCCARRAGDRYAIGNTLLRNWLRSELVREPAAAVSNEIAADMYSEEQQQITALIAQHERRLFLLQEQQALKGSSTPPEVLLEIEDIDKTVADLQRQLRALRTRAG